MTRFLHDHGITVTEVAPFEQALAMRRQTVPAFIGRALRGPLNTPVLIDSLAAYKRRFGDVWHRSTLSHAVDQFFAHGGRRLYVVRVANNATGVTLRLNGDGGALTLRAAEPGSTEQIRAAVDYDGIGDDDHFNLVVQRLSPQRGIVIDQEIFGRVSVDEDKPSFIGDALAGSDLVELCTPIPASRPTATMGPHADSRSPYVLPVERGSDGDELCDYDLVGSRSRGTGIFSLDDVDDIDLLYLPPPSAERDAGMTALLAAELYCRRRGALLIVDPPRAWTDVRSAVSGVRDAGLASAHMVSYFPRLDTAATGGAAGGALAGLLCKLDATEGPWATLAAARYALGRRYRPALVLEAGDAAALQRAGINAIAATRDGRSVVTGDVTMAQAESCDRQQQSLPARRLCLQLGKSLERATRWAVFDADQVHAARQVEQQVYGYMQALAEAGAFAADRFSVRAAVQRDTAGTDRGLTVMLEFQPAFLPDPVSLTLYQAPSGCRMATTAFAPVSKACA